MAPRLDMLGITTDNLLESLRFYRLLGIDVPCAQGDEPYVECALPGGLRLSWNAVEMVRKLDPSWQPPAGHRLGMAFLVDSPAEVDATWKAVTDEGFKSHRDPWDAFWGQRYAVVVDPDGNLVDLFAWLPKDA
ncbi:MAG: VOC family protein [Myxococcales bacterium]|nr:VOC family protein [Myxococcales bacterium]